jgi:hypothetical protein
MREVRAKILSSKSAKTQTNAAESNGESAQVKQTKQADCLCDAMPQVIQAIILSFPHQRLQVRLVEG